MLAFDPPSLMELRWADDILRFELQTDGAGCILRLRVTFPEHGKVARDAAGRHVRLDQLVILGMPPTPPRRARNRPTAGRWFTGPTCSGSGPRRRPSGRPRTWRRGPATSEVAKTSGRATSRRDFSMSMQGKVVVITGANTGVGLETAVGVAAQGVTTVLACRHQAKAEAAAHEVTQRTWNDDVHTVSVDLADLTSVRKAAGATS